MSPPKDPKLVALISMVRNNRVLYDYRLEKYKDEAYKNNIWAEEGTKCGFINARAAKTAWNELYKNFMICYRNELIRLARLDYDENKVKLPKEQNTHIKETWNYYSEMSFIAPFRPKTNPELERLVELVKPTVLRTAQQTQKPTNAAISIATVSASAETQTPAEDVHMDIPPIDEANMSEKEMCLRSFFDAMFRATNSLPVRLQSKVKRDLLESVNDAEIKAEIEKMNIKISK